MRFPHTFLNSLALNLTDSVKKGDFPDQSQSFRFFARSHQNKLRHHWTGLAIITWLVVASKKGCCRANRSKLEDTYYIYKHDLELKDDLQMQSGRKQK